MHPTPFRLPFAMALASLLVVTAAAASPPTVHVRYDRPEQFTETREVRAYAFPRQEMDYLRSLKQYIRERATKALHDDQTLDITITDVDRAGSYLPTAASPYPVRIVSDLYPPRIDLGFRLLDRQGRVVRQGQRKLIGMGFLQDAPGAGVGTDPLRFEKRLIDRWLRRGPDKL